MYNNTLGTLSYKSLTELTQLAGTTFEKTTQIYTQLLNNANKTLIDTNKTLADAFINSCKILEETTAQSTSSKK
jgi:hypothetical protein